MTEKTSSDLLKEAWQNPDPEADRECAEGLAEIFARSRPEFSAKPKEDQVSAMQALIEEVEARMFSTRH